MNLSTKHKQQLRAAAHPLKPIVTVGQHGLTDTVKNEIDRALTDHELIKVRISAGRDERKAVFQEICESAQAAPINLIGGIAILYRESKKELG